MKAMEELVKNCRKLVKSIDKKASPTEPEMELRDNLKSLLKEYDASAKKKGKA